MTCGCECDDPVERVGALGVAREPGEENEHAGRVDEHVQLPSRIERRVGAHGAFERLREIVEIHLVAVDAVLDDVKRIDAVGCEAGTPGVERMRVTPVPMQAEDDGCGGCGAGSFDASHVPASGYARVSATRLGET